VGRHSQHPNSIQVTHALLLTCFTLHAVTAEGCAAWLLLLMLLRVTPCVFPQHRSQSASL
jgi:hypothetical protein